MSLLINPTTHNERFSFSIQAFIRFSAGDKEIFYVTKHNTETGDYSFELDINEAASDFGSLSDSYAMVGCLSVYTYVHVLVPH